MTPAQAHPTTLLLAEQLEPALREDEELHGYPLLALLEVAGRPLGEVDDVVRDRDGVPGWARELDPATTTRPAWLGQFVGAVVPPGTSDREARFLITERPAVRRGSPGAIRSTVQQYLTGSRRVDLFERDGGAYRLRVRVYGTQLAAPVEELERALLLALPAGVKLTELEVYPGLPYDERDAGFATFDALDANATTFDELDRGGASA